MSASVFRMPFHQILAFSIDERPRKLRNLTVYAVLKAKLERDPTHSELRAEVKRILADG